MKYVRILIVDDHAIVRRGLRALIHSQPGWEVCGEAATGRGAVEKADQLRPDIVVLDANLTKGSGTSAAREILKRVPETEVLIFTVDESPELMRELLLAGARGYVFKSDFDRDLANAITSLSRHKPYFTSKVAQMMAEHYQKSQAELLPKTAAHLTPRQREVVRLLAEGKTNKEVAGALNISVKTAETHRAAIMNRMKFGSFSELIRYAVNMHIIGS